MNKLYKIRHPEVFQGEKHLKNTRPFFEGWYFKTTSKKTAVAFIPGISITNNEKKAFIQVITTNNSYYINYPIEDFKYNINPFYIKIRDNYFSFNNIHIDINEPDLRIKGDIYYIDHINIKKKFLSPNIMGPFSYLSFMECNHAICSMKCLATGTVKINNKNLSFKNNCGYIEKDYGISFPKNYIWCQANRFKKANAAFILSIADVPLKKIFFRGVICVLIINNEEYKFTTYNGAKIITEDIGDNNINITIEKGHYNLNIKAYYNKSLKLLAPHKGQMKKTILESITSNIKITLKKDHKIIFKDSATYCGLEIVTN